MNALGDSQLADNELAFGIFDWLDGDPSQSAELYEQRLEMLTYADSSATLSSAGARLKRRLSHGRPIKCSLTTSTAWRPAVVAPGFCG